MFRFFFALFLVVAACSGSPITPKILGGSDADISDFPYMVSIEFIHLGHYCGAAIVSANWILTDAWCVSDPVDVLEYTVRSGSALLGNGTLHNVTQWIHHPQSDVFNSEFDFALVQVDPPFEFGENVAAVSLPILEQETPDANVAVILGWGEVDGSEEPTIAQLQFANLTVLGEAACSEALGSDYHNTKLCAQDRNGVVAHCWRDEGGPLVIGRTLYGIALWPSYCNNPLDVQIYSRVSAVKSWIDATIAV